MKEIDKQIKVITMTAEYLLDTGWCLNCGLCGPGSYTDWGLAQDISLTKALHVGV